MSAEENSSPAPEPREPSEPVPHGSELPSGGNFEPRFSPPGPPPFRSESKWLPPENYHVPWGWLDVLVLLPIIGLGLLILFAVIITAVAVAVFHIPLNHIREHFTFIGLVAQIVMELSLLGYFALQIRHRSGLPFWRTIGWRPLRPRTIPRGAAYLTLVLGGVGLALFVSLASNIFPPKHPLPIEKIYASRSLTLLFMFTAVAVAPLVEETIFRGYLFPVASRTFGVVGGIVFTGTVFGLLHGMQLWGGWWQIGLLIMVGIVFTCVRAVTRTVFSSFTLHVSYNGLQVIGLLISLYAPKHLFHIH